MAAQSVAHAEMEVTVSVLVKHWSVLQVLSALSPASCAASHEGDRVLPLQTFGG